MADGRLLLVFTAALLGCAPQAPATAVAPAAPTESSAPTDPVARAAVELAAAEEAYAAGDDPRLARSIDRLRMRRVHPLGPDDADLVATWQSRVGPSASPPLRGRALGPGYRRGTIGPGAVRETSQVFLSGQRTVISLGQPRGRTLMLRLFDAEGKMVCSHDPAHGEACRFTPVYTQRYRIEIRNGGDRDEVYFLAVG